MADKVWISKAAFETSVEALQRRLSLTVQSLEHVVETGTLFEGSSDPGIMNDIEIVEKCDRLLRYLENLCEDSESPARDAITGGRKFVAVDLSGKFPVKGS